MRCELPSVSRCRKAAGLTRWVRHPVQTPSHGRADRTRNPGASSGAPGFFVLGRVRAWSRNSGWDAWRHCCRRSAPRARWRSLVRGECIRRAVQFLASQRAPPPGCRGARQRHAAAERFVVETYIMRRILGRSHHVRAGGGCGPARPSSGSHVKSMIYQGRWRRRRDSHAASNSLKI